MQHATIQQTSLSFASFVACTSYNIVSFFLFNTKRWEDSPSELSKKTMQHILMLNVFIKFVYYIFRFKKKIKVYSHISYIFSDFI